jgi:hypothetical protein
MTHVVHTRGSRHVRLLAPLDIRGCYAGRHYATDATVGTSQPHQDLGLGRRGRPARGSSLRLFLVGSDARLRGLIV